MTEVMVCPKCKSNPKIFFKVDSPWHKPTRYKLVCPVCGWGKDFEWTEGDCSQYAIENWNLRVEKELKLMRPYDCRFAIKKKADPFVLIKHLSPVLSDCNVVSINRGWEGKVWADGEWKRVEIWVTTPDGSSYAVSYHVRKQPVTHEMEWLGDYEISSICGDFNEHLVHCYGGEFSFGDDGKLSWNGDSELSWEATGAVKLWFRDLV